MLNCLRLGIYLAVTLTTGSASQMEEYQIKTAFLYNFAKFVKWPAQTFTASSQPMVICVMGDTALIRALEDTVAGQEVEGRRLGVKTISEARQMNACQILFVSRSEQKRVASILAACRSTGVLTVGETEGFAAQGGVVNFRIEDDRVRFEINIGAANEQGLQISSKLLSLARIVTTKAGIRVSRLNP